MSDDRVTLRIGDVISLRSVKWGEYLSAEGIFKDDLVMNDGSLMYDDDLFSVHLPRQYSAQIELNEFIEKYFASYPKIKNYIDSSINFAKEHEYSMTLSGRKRPLRDINVASGLQLSNLQNMAVNSPVQGTASDLIKLAMVKIQNDIPKTGLRLDMLVQVHDELIFECHQDDVEKSKTFIKECMESAMELSVPLKVEVGSGKDWLEAH